MGLKGINPFEENADKIALGVCCLLAAGIFVWQFATPLTVQTSGGSPTTPGAAANAIQSQASSASAEMNNPTVPPDLPAVPNLAARFDEALAGSDQPITVAGLYPHSGTTALPGEIDLTQPVGPGEVPMLAVVDPPAPEGLLAHVFGGSVDPLEVFRVSSLESLVPDEQPYDLFVPTVEAQFPVGQFVAALRQDGEEAALPEGTQPIPSRLWEGRTELIGVELERERWDAAKGEWTDRTVIEPLDPNASLLIRAQAEGFAPAEFGKLLQDELTHREGIRRPHFLPILSPECWMWPTLATSQSPSPAQIEERDRLLREIQSMEREIARLNNLLNPGTSWLNPGIGQPGYDLWPLDGMPMPAADWPLVPPTVLAQGGGGGGGPRPDPGPDPSIEQRRRERIQQQIETAQRRLDNALAKLQDLGFDRSGNPVSNPCSVTISEPAGSLTLPDIESFTVWSHDFTAQRGGLYRYRMRVHVTNPLYGNARLLNDAQKPLAEQVLLASDWSQWTQPVRVPAEAAVFATASRSGSAIGGVGGTGARRAGGGSFNFFKFVYGYWRQLEGSVESGDRIAVTGSLGRELPIFQFEGTGTNRRLLEGNELMPETMEIATALYLVDVPVEAGASEILVATADGRLLLYRAHEGGKVLEAFRESSRVGLNTPIRRPGESGGNWPGPTPPPTPGGGSPPPGGGGGGGIPGGGGLPPDR